MLPEILQHFTNWGEKFLIDDLHAGHYLFCYTSKPNNSTSQQVNTNEKAVFPSQQCRATVGIG